MRKHEMKIVHCDSGAALSFTWSAINATSATAKPSDCPDGAITPGGGYSNPSAFTHGAGDGDLKSSAATKSPAEQLPRDRYHHAACCVGNRVYVFGGKSRFSPLKDLWRLDVVSGQWESLASWSLDLPHLQGHTITACQSQILIFGGTFCESALEETPLWIINTDLQCVRKYRPDSPSCMRPTGRREHSCVIHRNKLYIYGGFLDSSGSTDEFWTFSLDEEQWRSIRRRKPGKRHGHVAVVKGNHMWLHGGMKGLKKLSDLWTFNFSLCTWDAVKSQGPSPLLSNHTAHVVSNNLLLFGGTRQGELSNSVWILQFDTLTWRQITDQRGDCCPPVSLHASVVLGKSLHDGADNSSTDRTHSVPQLQHHGSVSQAGQLPVRPWTSPGQDLNEACSGVPLIGSNKFPDLLQLESFQPSRPVLIDKNNNASEEDLTCDAETSFFVPTSISGHLIGKGILPQPGLGKFGGDIQTRMTNANPPSSERDKVRSASIETCNDGLPLLKRFQSVTSNEDLGHNNLTLTLSDEQLDEPDRPTYGLCLSHRPQQQALRDLQSKSCNTEHGHPQNKFLLARLATDNHSSEANNRKPFASGRSCNFVNPLYTGSDMDGSNTAVLINTTGARFYRQSSKRSASYSDIYETENMFTTQSDMVLEDLEGLDMSGLLCNVAIPPPSTLSVSLNELDTHIKSSQDFKNLVNISSTELAQVQHVSCGDISLSAAVEESWRNSSSHVSSNIDKVPWTCNTSTQSSKAAVLGRYIKNPISSSSSAKVASIIKYRSKYFSSSQLDRLVTTSSVGTQTAGSQLCLHADPSSTRHKVFHPPAFPQAASTSSQNSSDLHRPAQRQVTLQSKVSPRTSSVTNLADCQLCLLVIGGQTESPSFTAEPLKLWRCRLL